MENSDIFLATARRVIRTERDALAQLADGLGAEFAAWLRSDQIYRTRQGVAAVKRALGAAQHFYTLDISRVEDGSLRLTDVDAIQIYADCRLPCQRWIDCNPTAN